MYTKEATKCIPIKRLNERKEKKTQGICIPVPVPVPNPVPVPISYFLTKN